MGLFRGSAAVTPPPPDPMNPQRCDACGSVGPQPLEPATMEGVALVLCVEPCACRRRWEASVRHDLWLAQQRAEGKL